MTQADLVGFAIELSARTNVYWNIYITVVTAIFGLFVSGKVDTTQFSLKLVVTAMFTAFAATNFRAMNEVGKARQEVSSLIENEALASTLAPSEPHEYAVFHIFLWCIILIAIWVYGWLHERTSKDGQNG
jgi:magnesium-transporting ATPase (P-type)